MNCGAWERFGGEHDPRVGPSGGQFPNVFPRPLAKRVLSDDENRRTELGSEIVKVFPGSSVGGPEFVKNVMGPMPWTRIMPTGGVEATEQSLRQWFGAGIVACGIGSNLVTKKLLDAKDYAGIEQNVRTTVQLVKTIKADLAAKQ